MIIFENLKEGEEITYKNFLSSTKDRSYAGTVARKNFNKTGEAAVIVIESKNGKNIIKYSDLEAEAEFLHKSNSSFILKSVEENKLLNAYEHFLLARASCS
jgi:hypothetical protein